MENSHNPDTHDLVPDTGHQTSIWGAAQLSQEDGVIRNPFAPTPEEAARLRLIAKHKAWLGTIQHEYPSPYEKLRIGVYIRFFNQTKYTNYLDYHKQQFIDTIAMCPNWTIVDFYVDTGATAPYMENAAEWTRLLEDCFAKKVDLIITQKISNVTRDPAEVTFLARALATQKPPIGMYFINEDLYTLATYYKADLRERGFIPPDLTPLPDEDPLLLRGEPND